MQDDVRSAVPRTDHQEEDALVFRKQIPRRRWDSEAITTRKKAYVDEQSRIAPQKPNRRTPRARFADGRGFRRHLLSRCSVRAEVRDEKSQRAAEMWSLGSEGEIGLTDDFYFYAQPWGGRKPAEELRRRKLRCAINSPPP